MECGVIFLKYFNIIHVTRFVLHSGKCCEIDMEKQGNLMCANAFIQEAALIYQKDVKEVN